MGLVCTSSKVACRMSAKDISERESITYNNRLSALDISDVENN